VRSEVEGGGEFVPRLASTLALALVLVSIGFLIYFIDHAARSIQLAVILDRVTRQTKENLERVLPMRSEEEVEVREQWWKEPAEPPAAVPATSSGYLQAVDEEGLGRLCEECDVWMRMEPRIGEF